jgi:hypothetical protein
MEEPTAILGAVYRHTPPPSRKHRLQRKLRITRDYAAIIGLTGAIIGFLIALGAVLVLGPAGSMFFSH